MRAFCLPSFSESYCESVVNVACAREGARARARGTYTSKYFSTVLPFGYAARMRRDGFARSRESSSGANDEDDEHSDNNNNNNWQPAL